MKQMLLRLLRLNRKPSELQKALFPPGHTIAEIQEERQNRSVLLGDWSPEFPHRGDIAEYLGCGPVTEATK